jgi:hypothetical protein
MKKVLFVVLAAVAAFRAGAVPYTTPNTGVRWTMDSLVAYSGGTVTGGGGTYTVTDEVIVAAADRLTIAGGTTVNHASGSAVGLTVRGVVRAEGTVSLPVRFLGSGTPASYRGVRVEDSAVDSLTVFRYCHVFDATEGIHCLNASPLIEACWFKGNSSNGVRCFTASPVIRNCLFESNSRNAVTVNLGSSPIIEGCTFSNNNTENTSPRNQINVGPQGANNPVIRNNTIQNGPYFRTGAISLTALTTGASCAAIVEGNTIRNNSFGILSQGIDMTPRIRYNLIENNTINPDPMVSGSGISVQVGGPTNAPVIAGNIIRGNLWGVTIVSSSGFANSPQPSLGNLNNADTSDDGWNIFSANGNGGVIYQLFNNGNANILAQNNYWGSADSATVERWITHRADSVVYGEVIYRPYGDRGFGAPQWFQVAQRGSDSVRLSWRYAGQPAGTVRVMAGADTNALQSIALLAARETTYVMPAPYGVPRWYAISSLNRFGESDTTAARFTVRDIFPPAVPGGLTVQLAGWRPPRGGVFLVSWRRNVEPDLRAYRVYRAIRDSSLRALLATVLAPDTSYRDSTVECDTWYYYWVSAQDTAGNEGASAVRQFGWPCPLGVEANAEVPREFALRVPYPNPFNPSTHIRYELPEPARVSLTVHDVLGRVVETLIDETKGAGYHAVQWNAAGRSSGVYLARFTATTVGGRVGLQRTMKLVLTK